MIKRLLIILLLVSVPTNLASADKVLPNVNYSYIWGKSYQSENCPTKKEHFKRRVARLYGKASKDEEIRQVAKEAANKYKHLGYNPDTLAELLYRIALHESDGGIYTKQINGPARSWFQIEPSTASGLIKNNPELIIGFNVQHLAKLSKQALANLLEQRQDIAATIAAAKIIETGERLGTNDVLKG